MSNFRLPETPDARRTSKAVKTFVGTLKELLAFSEEIDRIHEAEAHVASAKRQLEEVNGEVDKAKARAAAAEAEANSLIAVASQKVAAAEEASTATIAEIQRRHAEAVAATEKAASADIAAIDAKRVKAEADAEAAKRQLADVTAALDAALHKRNAMRAEIDALRVSL